MNIIEEYLNKKGLEDIDIFNHNGIILMDGKYYSYNKPKWCEDYKSLLIYKKHKYAENNVTNAIVLPVFDLYYEFCGISVRKFGTDNKQDSYYVVKNMKSKIAYGLNKSYTDIIKTNKVYIVEGQYDYIKLYKEGLKNTVALMGTSLSKHHVIQLRQFTENICIALDYDNAGINAINKIVKYNSNEFKFTYVKIDRDPDEYVHQYGLNKFLDNEYNLNQLLKNKLNRR